jgi:hypothetical protein
MHRVIADNCHHQPGCQAEAKRLGEGWVYVIDQRTPTPEGPIPLEDIIGGVEVKRGEIVPNSYRANPKHQILSTKGFFRLDPGLRTCLLRELASRNSEAE